MLPRPPRSTLFPYTTLFRSSRTYRRSCSTAGRSSVRCASISATRSRRPSSSRAARSEEHTSELQSRENLVCRLLLEKKNLPRDWLQLAYDFTADSFENADFN